MKYPIFDHKALETQKDFTVRTIGRSAAEVLESLDRIGIEWYLTEEGTLLVKSWQVVTESFVSPEEAIVIQSGRTRPEQGNELDWLSKNLQSVREKYGGQWIAIYDNRVVATAVNLPDLMGKISKLDKPFITFVPQDPIIWTSIYANSKL